jgi:hypothetical protein
MAVRLTVLVLLGAASACAARFTPPEAPAVPAPEAPAAWAEATAACRDVRTAHVQLRLAARAGDRRIPRLRAGLAIDDGRALALEAPSAFTLRGTAGDATLVLGDGRYVRAPVADIVEALIDVRLEPSRLLAILTGCVAPQPDLIEAVRREEWLVVTSVETVVYLGQSGAAGWQVRAGEFAGLLVEYRHDGPAWPRAIDIRSGAAAAGPPVSIAISGLEFLEVNASVDAALFQPVVPPGAVEITLAELTRALEGR